MGAQPFERRTGKNGVVYTIWGDEASAKSSIVFIHGWSCQGSDYDYILHEIFKHPTSSADFLAIVPDLPGHGSSPPTSCPDPSITSFADVIIALTEEIGSKDVVFAGHSMGVRIVAEIWRRLQSVPKVNVPGIVFIDGSDYRNRPALPIDNAPNLAASKREALTEGVFRDMFSPLTPEGFRTAALEHLKAREKAYVGQLRSSMIAYDRECMTGTLEMLGGQGDGRRPGLLNLQSSDTSAPGGMRVPLKEGETSPWMRWIQETVPWAEQRTVSGSVHFPHVDRPGFCWEVVQEFVERTRAKQREIPMLVD